MEQKTGEKREFKGLSRGWWTFLMILLPFLALGVFGLGFYAIIEYLHYSVGILLALIALTLVSGWMWGVLQNNWISKVESLPSVDLISTISFSFISIFVLSATGAWVSYALHALGIVKLLEISGEPTYGNILQTYLWHLTNVIPLTNVEKTFGMKDPIVQFTGWIAGFPILAFRFAVVVIILGAIQEAWRTFQKNSEEALWKRLKKRMDAAKLVGKDEKLENTEKAGETIDDSKS